MKLSSENTLKLFSKKWSQFGDITMNHGSQSCRGPSLVRQTEILIEHRCNEEKTTVERLNEGFLI